MPLLPRDRIDEVRERTNIVEVVKRHVELKRAGNGSWKGLCPFHAEKSPSFHVNEQRQYFYCFGCGEKGDVFTFLAKAEQRSFMEIVRDLAQLAAVELPEKALTPAERKAMSDAESERERLHRAMETAVQFFQDQYAGPAGAAARAYVEGRGLSARVVERFRVGYAPAGWSNLQAFLVEKQFPMQVAERLGLVGVNERGRYDFFRDRVMLPVIDRQKRPVGFSSRLLDPEAKDRKYVNSSDSPLFHKKEQLYGLHAALDAIRKSGTAVVVEGNFDVMSLHEAGVEEAVAPMGTALTGEQIGMLGRIAQRIIVVFDGDGAGLRAAQKSVPLFVDADADGRVAQMPAGVDPDDFVRKEGAGAFRKLMASARPVIDQLIDDMKPEDNTPGRLNTLATVAPLLARVKEPIAREMYIGRLAATLKITSQQVMREIRSAGASRSNTGLAESKGLEAEPNDAGDVGASVVSSPRIPSRDELEVIALLCAHPTPALVAAMDTARILDLLVDPAMRQLLRSGLDSLRADGRLDVPAWLEAGPADVRDAVAVSLMDGRYAGMEDPERVLRSLHARLQRLRIEAEIAMSERLKREALSRGDEAMARAIGVREIELIRTKQGLQETRERP